MTKKNDVLLWCLLVFLIVSLSSASSPTAPATRMITADVGVEKGPLSQMFNLCVGAGRANEGLRADWQRQLAYVHRECGFRYLRFHGLLCDDMGVYSEDKNGQPVYNWQYIDELFDSMLNIGVKPFVEIGFMPSALASGQNTIFWWKGNVTPPKDYAKWEALVKALFTHWKERYGENEVATWYFEVWNEPNLDGFWLGSSAKKGKTDKEFPEYAQQEYFKLYASTAKAIKAVSSRFRVGGPATAGCAWVPETIDFCVKNKVPIDFISTHHYCVNSGFLDENGTAGTILSQDPNAMSGRVHNVRRQIAESASPSLELHFTEWSSSYTPSDPIHDSYHSAAFILNSLRRSGSDPQSMSYWTFTDIFEENGPRTTPFHGGFGLINYQGINKPAFYAYQFLNRLGTIELKSNDEASLIAKDDKGAVQVLFWDFTITHPGEKVLNQDFYKRDLPPKRAMQTTLRISGLKSGRYAATLYKVGYRVNDAYATYCDLGSPSQLTRAQVAFIKDKNDGSPLDSKVVIVGDDGVFAGNYEVRENDVCLVTLSPL
ncbi:MAG: glycoside hydrolase [Sedimentisphaerales bacterium]|jgi:xylan 1,4-beta-xylosidase